MIRFGSGKSRKRNMQFTSPEQEGWGGNVTIELPISARVF